MRADDAAAFGLAFQAPVFRGLDERARGEIARAGKLRSLAPGEVLFRPGDGGDAFCVVTAGRIDIAAVRRGEDVLSHLRSAARGDLFGEEAILSSTRRTEARAVEPATVAEVPVHLFRRAAGRVGGGDVLGRFERTLKRNMAKDLLSTLAFGKELDADLFDALLDRITHHGFARGQAIYRQGEPCQGFFIVAEGVVELVSEDDERLRVRAFVTRGDAFGDEDTETDAPRAESAIASGPTTVLAVPLDFAHTLRDRAPRVLRGVRRIATEEGGDRGRVVSEVAKNATQHVFRDLYRFQVARSLLVIDQDQCVRCGHCAWACADVHGTSRLIRRGDKIITREPTAGTPSVFDLGLGDAGDKASSLLLPNSCQHCETPACMIDCPTGAIGKDPTGEVFVRPELCTGCGACARACPWDNIQMAERPKGAPRPPRVDADEVAEKCDLCRGFVEGPACVRACPVDAIFRIDPQQDLAELRDFFGVEDRQRPSRGRAKAAWIAGAAVASAGVAIVGLLNHARNVLSPGRGLGLAAGIATAALFVALLAYVLPKRLVRARMTPRKDDTRRAAAREVNRTRSVTSGHTTAHVALGMIAAALSLAHHPPTLSRSTSGAALSIAFLVAAASGAIAMIFYAVLPPRLTRLERSALVPEDIPGARESLQTALFRGLSGKSDLMKKVAEKILLPYAKAPFGPLALLASGRSLREEERALKKRVDALLEGRGRERLAGLSELTRTVVELRALPAARALLVLLRVPVVVHVIAFAVALPLLAAHLWGVLR